MNTPQPSPDELLADGPLDLALLEFTAPLPEWLRTANAQKQEAYSEMLTAYHAAASRLEQHLQAVLPSFDDFTSDQLNRRIKTDLGIDVDPQQFVLDVPVSVSQAYEIDPQFGRVKSYAAPWVPSEAREQFSLGELARRNFPVGDEQMAHRLSFAESDLTETRYVEAGLTASYLHRVIPQLDVAQGYRNLLRTVFHVPTQASEAFTGLSAHALQRRADLLLEPHELKLLLEGFCAATRRRLTDDGYRMLRLAAVARSRRETDAARLEMNWVVFKPGHAVSGEGGGHTLDGLCAVRDLSSGRTLIYLPDAPGDLVFVEGATSDEARSRLIQQLISHDEWVAYLSERTLDAANRARHASYIKQALMRGFEGFIRFEPALDLQMAAQQLSVRAGAVYRMTEILARSQFDLDREASRAQNADYLGYFRALLGLLPGIGTLISLQGAWDEGHEAAKAFRAGRLDDGLLAAGGVALGVVDVAMSIIPGAASIRVLTRYGARAGRLKPVVSGVRRYEVRPFEGYEAHRTLSDAIPQTGRDAGTFLQDGQLWIQREGQTYAVYRRASEETLRLKRSSTHGYEPPVRFENGDWVYHTDVGLKGGVKSSIAEILIAKAHADPAFTHRQARQLLDGFEFPPDRQRRLELDVAIHYETHREVPTWAETYRRPAPAPDTAPAAPGGVKRKGGPVTESEAKRVAGIRPGTSGAAFASPDAWKQWGQPLGVATGIERTDAIPPIFRRTGLAGDFIQMDGLRYDVLPGGGSPSTSTVFLKAPTTVDQSLTGLDKAVRITGDQPVMASFFNGAWTVHGPLFKRAIHELIEQGRPGLTPASYRVLAEKLFELADQGQTGWTGTRLINMKAALNAWQKGGQARLPALNDPLLMLEGARMEWVRTPNPSLNVGTGPSLRTFNRLDFVVNEASFVEKLIVAVTEDVTGHAGKTSLRELMSALVAKAGYVLIAPDDALLQRMGLLMFQREGLEPAYLMKLRRFHGAKVTLKVASADSPAPMSNRWMDEWMAAHPDAPVVLQLRTTREQGRLVKLMGGLKVTSQTDAGTQVFMQRLADDF
ncbi:hypothetical protein SAMN03159444_01618 [Pseudomonas sp. NFACC02]|uniref:dermonecrotic toxin domain-containing protein n=1 Tax=Pseudomonas sp. NFACC02 TaxID=1566250 RepID=UPI0008B1F123|nr:DUF6543 domain-containing protein [Pseudomonas sp. NFACC02]SEQ40316.1 hypothetical protein SAMN03159444_01618 [Pseudomonas sp. NFACC02]